MKPMFVSWRGLTWPVYTEADVQLLVAVLRRAA